jgi:hypothetical protein
VTVGGNLLHVEIGDFPDNSASITPKVAEPIASTPKVAEPIAPKVVTPIVPEAPTVKVVPEAPKVKVEAPVTIVKEQVGERGETRVCCMFKKLG